MSAANLFASPAPTAAPGQPQGAGLGVVGALGGLFGGADGQTGDPADFVEALMSALMAGQGQTVQPQAQTAKDGDAVEAAPEAIAPAANGFTPQLLAQVQGADEGAGQPAVSGEAVQTAATEETLTFLAQPAAPEQGEAPEFAAVSTESKGGKDRGPESAPGRAELPPLTLPEGPKPNGPGNGHGPERAVEVHAALAAAASATASPEAVEALATAPVAEPVAAAEETRSAAAPPVAAQAAAAAQEAVARTPAAARSQAPAHAHRAESRTHEDVEPSLSAQALGDKPSIQGQGAKSGTSIETAANAGAAPAEDEAATVEAAEPAKAETPAPFASHLAQRAGHAGDAPLGDAPKVTAHTVAQLSAQIAKAIDGGKTTRFDVQLEPHGLGRVDVKVEINRAGDIVADLRFDNPMAAADLKARAGELASALETAGFDPSKTQLSFSSGGGQQFAGQFAQDSWNQQQGQGRGGFSHRAFMDLGDAPETQAGYAPNSARSGGVDVRI